MPHLTLEYTKNTQQDVNFTELFSALHQILADVGGINIENCKSRSIRHDDYHVGRGGPDSAFVHLEVLMLEGRPLTLKREIGQQILSCLKGYYASSLATHDLQITVQVGDIERTTYFKIPENTFTPLKDSGESSPC